VSRSTYYESSEPQPEAPDELTGLVRKFAETHTASGYRMLAARLRRKGHRAASEKRVRLRMRRLGLKGRRRRRFVRTTVAGKEPAGNNLMKDLKLDKPRQALVTDLTYVALPKGKFAYVAVVLDAFSRRALGFSSSTSLHQDLPERALKRVLDFHELPKGWIHHSDRGAQYTSGAYKSLVQNNSGRLSNSRKGNPYDNAKIESFFKTYKYEEANLADYQSLEELNKNLAKFIYDYNSDRPHSSLGYKSPIDFELLHAEQEQMGVR